MVSSLLSSTFHGSSLQIVASPSISTFQLPKKFQSSTTIYLSVNPPPRLPQQALHKLCVPLAISLVLSWSTPAQAGFLSGFSGIESVPGPELPSIDFLNRFNGKLIPYNYSIIRWLASSHLSIGFVESNTQFTLSKENQKKYAENDERIKSSPIIKELLERSKKNKEKNKQEILDKYCMRGAEWGVGDCSTQGMTEEERDNFIAMLKQKVEPK